MSSLRNRISSARTASAIDKLLDEGKTYEFATPKTKRRWAVIAAKRRGELDSPAPAVPTQAAEGERPSATAKPKAKRVPKAKATA